MTEDISMVIEVMAEVYGRSISDFDISFLKKTITQRLGITGIFQLSGYCEYLVCHPDEAELLYSSLFVSFSEFFRNTLTFAMIEHMALPRLIEKKLKSGKTEIRIWSAGCSAGQESYSLAILLDDFINSAETPVSYRIFATDISDNELKKGIAGVYDTITVSNVRMKHMKTYFHSGPERVSIIPRLKDQVDFSFYDLLDSNSASPPGSIFGDFDIIFCSNLFFYYKPESQKLILNKIHQALSDEGYLASGETERAIVLNSGLFTEICRPSAVFRKKPAGVFL
jgi:chemotaxis methyl-accepting protein methylase